jgi:hypothetical protein
VAVQQGIDLIDHFVTWGTPTFEVIPDGGHQVLKGHLRTTIPNNVAKLRPLIDYL